MHLLYGLLRDEAAVHGGAAGRCAVHVIDQLVERLRESRADGAPLPSLHGTSGGVNQAVLTDSCDSVGFKPPARTAVRTSLHGVTASWCHRYGRHGSHVMHAVAPCARCGDQSRASTVLQDR